MTRALLESYVAGCAPVSKTALREFTIAWNWPASDRERWRDEAWLEEHYVPTIDAAVWTLGDTGIYREEGDTLALTPFGDVFVTAWLGYLESEDAD